MMNPIKKILKQDFKNSGISNKKSFILAQTAYNEYSKFKILLDNDYETIFINAKNGKDDPIDVKSDRLTELAYTKFLSNNFKLSNPNGKIGLDIKIDDINGWGEYKSIRIGKPLNNEKEDFISRITNALSKKFVAVQKNRNTKQSAKNYIADTQPVILFFEFNKKVVDKFRNILNTDFKSENLPLILQALFPVDEYGKENVIQIQNTKNEWIELHRRYFTDREAELYDNGKSYICDLCTISAVVFSETITNFIFEDRLKEKWKNDLVLVHNPFARNPIKEKLFPTDEEWRCIFDENTKMFTITEIHNKKIIK